MSQTIRYRVPGVHCGHCAAAIEGEVSGVDGVVAVEVDLDSKVVTVWGGGVSDAAVRAAIQEAGYEAA